MTGSATVFPARAAAPVRRAVRSRFFLVISGAMFAALLIGFAPTFYLKTWFKTPALPGYLYVHGSVLTAWFALFFVQTLWVASGRTDIHRRLGILAAAIAAAVAAAGLITVARFIPRHRGLGLQAIADQVVGNVLSLSVFVLMVATAVVFRARSETHKRLMLLACMSIWPPVTSRYLSRIFVPLGVPFLTLGVTELTWLLALIGYDLMARRRLHAATLWGGLVIVLLRPLSWLVAHSAAGQALVSVLSPA